MNRARFGSDVLFKELSSEPELSVGTWGDASWGPERKSWKVLVSFNMEVGEYAV